MVQRFWEVEEPDSAPDIFSQAGQCEAIYYAFMLEYESLGHISVAPSPGIYFIPHHPVFKGPIFG